MLVLASSIAPSDTATSILLTDLAGPQIRLGRVPLDSHADVEYSAPSGPDGRPLPLRLDLLVPRTEGRPPLVVYVTGGGFVLADKSNGLNLRSYLAESGFAVASIEYRTVLNGATYADGVADVKAAVRYLRAHAGEYGIDADRVGLWGESAGGYLVSMAGVTNGLAEFEVGAHLDRSSAVQAVVDKFGASDLAGTAADFDEAARYFATQPDNPQARYAGIAAGGSVLTDPAAVARANPVTYVSGDAPPFLLLHGTADALISPSQTLLLHTALRAAGASSTRYVLDGANHGDLVFLGDPEAGLPWSTTEVMDRSVAFLASRLTARVSSP
jgi:acetyl esterase/lipase